MFSFPRKKIKPRLSTYFVSLIVIWVTRNCKGPHTINAANVGSTRDLISQKNVWRQTIDCKADTIRCAPFKHGVVRTVKCLGWHCWSCPTTFNFAFSRHQSWHSVSSRLETRNVAARVSGRRWVQSTELDIVNGSFCNLCALAVGLALHIFATSYARYEPQEGRNCCPLLRSYFIGSCHVGVSKRFSRSISLAVYCLSSYIFFGWSDLL